MIESGIGLRVDLLKIRGAENCTDFGRRPLAGQKLSQDLSRLQMPISVPVPAVRRTRANPTILCFSNSIRHTLDKDQAGLL